MTLDPDRVGEAWAMRRWVGQHELMIALIVDYDQRERAWTAVALDTGSTFRVPEQELSANPFWRRIA